MNTLNHPGKKQILADPAAFFAEYNSDDNHTIEQLNTLGLQRSEVKNKLKTHQQQSKKLSRKIGEAKKNNSPYNDLKTEMQQLSLQINAIKSEITQIETSILAFFEADNKNNNDQAKNKKTTARYALENEPANITVSLLQQPDTQWNNYIQQHPAATIYHRTEWQQLVRQCYKHESFYFIAHAGDKTVGVLPLIRLKSSLFGDLLVSMPWFQTGGAIAEHPAVEQQLMAAAAQHAKSNAIAHIEYRDDIARDIKAVQTNKVNMVLSLPQNEQQLWHSFSSKLRSQINRPLREKPQIVSGDIELLDDFYKVYARNMRDLGSPAHSKSFIKAIMQTFCAESTIFIIRLNNKPVSAALLLDNNEMLDIPLASTVRDVNHLSMNMLLYWEVLKFAVNKGYRYFNFGRSSKDAGTYRFKQQWGAEPKQLYWHYWLDGNDELPGLNTSNPKYQLVIALWKKLPVSFASWLGPKIVRYIP